MPRRRLRRHIAWRVDADYRAKLSADDLVWLDQFEREYYEGDFRGSPVHPPEMRRDCYRRGYSARVDAATAPELPTKRAGQRQARRYYDPSDWATNHREQTPNDVAEALAEALDRDAA